MINVLQVGLTPRYGGVESYIFNYYKYLDRTIVDFDFVNMLGEPTYVNNIKDLSGKYYYIGNYKKKPINVAKRFQNLLKEKQYDIVHVNMNNAINIIPIWVATHDGGGPIVIGHSHNTGALGMLGKTINAVNIGKLRKMSVEKWACSVKAGKWLWGDTFNSSNVIPNAIDTDRFRFDAESRSSLRKHCGFQKQDRVIGFVGRLAEQKNVFFLPEILDNLRKLSCNYKMLVVGDGNLRDSLTEKFRQMGTLAHVHFAGLCEDTSPWYSAMDMFVLPSKFEGFGIVGLEAQACGLPCFVSDAVPKELNITNTVRYLPISQGAKIWADAIHTTIREPLSKTPEFPQEYQIAYAAKQLERRYLMLMEQKP